MNRKIILVDDDQNLLSSFKRTLADFELNTAASAAQALEIIDAQGPFAVLVSDLRMPGMDGLSFLSRVKDRHPDTVRMVLTGHGNMENAVKAVNDGYVFRFMTKPIATDDMKKALESGLEQHGLILAGREIEALKRIRGTLDGVVSAFTSLVELRDPYTAGHQKRVAHLATAMAQDMGLDQERIDGLRMAAMVHDIGKNSVPSAYLNKPGLLNQAEMAIIRTHPRVGFDILDPVDFPWPVSRIVLQHHERLDGSGYPQGLRAKDILIEARILAVADVVDAMASHRPYRPSQGIKKALMEIQTKAGSQYDAEAVNACVRLFKAKGYSLVRGVEVPRPSPDQLL